MSTENRRSFFKKKTILDNVRHRVCLILMGHHKDTVPDVAHVQPADDVDSVEDDGVVAAELLQDPHRHQDQGGTVRRRLPELGQYLDEAAAVVFLPGGKAGLERGQLGGHVAVVASDPH